ncbi:MAG TPA: MarR family winged helix-turn-helix transcriptional regulator [Polyangiaceae bacterium]|nr:MarR family winged helix-turn-helix transcriptional regulator [Polyangiaceae bacterium]
MKAGARPRGGATDDIRHALNSLRLIVRTLRVSSRNAELEVGLSGAQLFVLQGLLRQGPCSVGELAAYTATDQSSVSVVVSRLVARGHVKRTRSKVDRRSVVLALTPSGRALLARAPEAAQERLLGALAQLERSELATLAALLAKTVELADVPRDNPTLFFEEGPVLVRSKGRAQYGRK